MGKRSARHQRNINRVTGKSKHARTAQAFSGASAPVGASCKSLVVPKKEVCRVPGVGQASCVRVFGCFVVF